MIFISVTWSERWRNMIILQWGGMVAPFKLPPVRYDDRSCLETWFPISTGQKIHDRGESLRKAEFQSKISSVDSLRARRLQCAGDSVPLRSEFDAGGASIGWWPALLGCMDNGRSCFVPRCSFVFVVSRAACIYNPTQRPSFNKLGARHTRSQHPSLEEANQDHQRLQRDGGTSRDSLIKYPWALFCFWFPCVRKRCSSPKFKMEIQLSLVDGPLLPRRKKLFWKTKLLCMAFLDNIVSDTYGENLQPVCFE